MRKSAKRNPHEEERINETWLIPYADMLTLLLALFIVLYAISSINTSRFEELVRSFRLAFNAGFGILEQASLFEQGKSQTKDRELEIGDIPKSTNQLRREEQQHLEELQEELNRYISQNGLTSELEIKLNHTELLIIIRDHALFDSGKADVKPEARRLALAISQMLEDYNDYEIVVSGHTDNVPINTPEFPSNWELSAKRAINFMKILLENKAFDPSRFRAVGYGEYQPIDPRDTPEARAKNRRVEVAILRKYSDVTETVPAAPETAGTVTAAQLSAAE
ncbi:MAG: flagellar motor protein MotB [Paenibacillaceae bacterium ZCTH02-B3]|nr:MAG: flagellar motor protein MotB [Paenibacillaceae bacterium ZCTH02-B3]